MLVQVTLIFAKVCRVVECNWDSSLDFRNHLSHFDPCGNELGMVLRNLQKTHFKIQHQACCKKKFIIGVNWLTYCKLDAEA